jgi:hypothetical protein
MAAAELDPPGITLPEAELQTRFEALQRKLVPRWELTESFNDEPHAMVVVPSLGGVDLPLERDEARAYRGATRGSGCIWSARTTAARVLGSWTRSAQSRGTPLAPT